MHNSVNNNNNISVLHDARRPVGLKATSVYGAVHHNLKMYSSCVTHTGLTLLAPCRAHRARTRPCSHNPGARVGVAGETEVCLWTVGSWKLLMAWPQDS